ncbi:hypothetical protein BVY03_01545 [bacterium K02(2017)]|nr:hypothetical protein BVY03_01545 [bacterium K02(2017)]
MKIRQAVIPAAGRGKKFLPVTKKVPKELLPVYDRPCIQYVIEEAVRAGVEEFIIVISEYKSEVKAFFERDISLEEWLLQNGNQKYLDLIKNIENIAKYKIVVQEELLGLGHAVLCAEPYIKDEYFFVLLPDDIIDAEIPVCQQMAEVFSVHQKPVVSVMQVPWDQVHRYGIVKADPLSEKVGDVKSIVEKPNRENAPSNLAVIGRYLLPQKIFGHIKNNRPVMGQEIELTDALQELIQETVVNCFSFNGDRFDAGTPLGLLSASLTMALKNPDSKEKVTQLVKMLASSV